MPMQLTGVLPVDKPEGPTSHDVVARARRALGIRRVGHTGTLDPFASGLLLLCLGAATRIAEYLTPLPKTYRAVLRLGEATDTDDVTGEVIRRSEAWTALDPQRIRAALAAQSGELQQLPPLYSAKKVAGERLYVAARRGEAPERKPVRVTVYRIELLALRLPDVEFEVECSSGTYIRAIARDVGEALGVGAHLRALRRTATGSFRVEHALAIEGLDDPGRVRAALVPSAAALAHLPRVVLDDEAAAAVANGRGVPAPAGLSAAGPVVLCSPAGELRAVAEQRGTLLQPRKVFA